MATKNDIVCYELVPTVKEIARTKQKLRGDSPMDVVKFLSIGDAFTHRPEQEHLYVLHLDTSCNIKYRELITIGNLYTTIASAREVFRGAVSAASYAIVIVHNHPSGDVTPSDADKDMTKNIIACGRILGIPVINHVVVSSDCMDYKSFVDTPELKKLWNTVIKIDGSQVLDFSAIDNDEDD